jgi:hypothetical protein
MEAAVVSASEANNLIPRQQTLASYMIDTRLTGDFHRLKDVQLPYLLNFHPEAHTSFFFPVCYSVLVTDTDLCP